MQKSMNPTNPSFSTPITQIPMQVPVPALNNSSVIPGFIGNGNY